MTDPLTLFTVGVALVNIGMSIRCYLLARRFVRLNKALANLALQAWLLRGYPLHHIAHINLRMEALAEIAKDYDKQRRQR